MQKRQTVKAHVSKMTDEQYDKEFYERILPNIFRKRRLKSINNLIDEQFFNKIILSSQAKVVKSPDIFKPFNTSMIKSS